MSIIQSVIFDKDKWTLTQAKGYLKKHGYKASFNGKSVDETKRFYRFRQANPKRFKNYFTKNLTKGVKLVIGNK